MPINCSIATHAYSAHCTAVLLVGSALSRSPFVASNSLAFRFANSPYFLYPRTSCFCQPPLRLPPSRFFFSRLLRAANLLLL